MVAPGRLFVVTRTKETELKSTPFWNQRTILQSTESACGPLANKAFSLDLDGGQITLPLTSRLEDGGLWQADSVILVNLRPNPDVTLRANASQMESRLLQREKSGITFTDNVDAGKKLNDLVEVSGGTTVQKPGKKHQVARLNGKVVEVWAAASRG